MPHCCEAFHFDRFIEFKPTLGFVGPVIISFCHVLSVLFGLQLQIDQYAESKVI